MLLLMVEKICPRIVIVTVLRGTRSSGKMGALFQFALPGSHCLIGTVSIRLRPSLLPYLDDRI
jgi:hypothetical protein